MRRQLQTLGALSAVALAALLCSACIHTSHDIHITLDIRHIETVVAAERKVKDVPLPTASKGRDTTVYSSPSASETPTSGLEGAVNRRIDRRGKVLELLERGVVGENNLGFLEMAPGRQAADDEALRAARGVVRSENEDRQNIYQEFILKRNLSPSEQQSLRHLWAEELRAKLRPAEWCQAPDHPEFFERFMRSKLGKRFAAAPQPGAWVQAPAE